MLALALAALLTSASQDPPADAVRIAVQADGNTVILRQDGTPPQPLFGRLLGDRENDSMLAAFANYGLLGNLGLFLSAPRPLSTMLDAGHYCERAGLRRAPEALIELLAPLPTDAGDAVQRRRTLDRLVALTLLARSAEPAARAALATAETSEDAFVAAWARQLRAKPGAASQTPLRDPPLSDRVAAVLANAPDNTKVVVVVDHAHLPRWQDLWRVAAEVGRAVARREVEASELEPDEARAAVAEADLVVERTSLLAYELARRIGNAIVEHTIVAAPSVFAVNTVAPWLHFDGAFEPERIASGLRAEGFTITTSEGEVQAVSATDTRILASKAAVAIDATAADARLGSERAKVIAADLAAPHLALSVSLLDDQAIGIRSPAAVQHVVEALRTIQLRHDGSDGAHLWLDLRYADVKPATVAATALGALLTAATGAAGGAPQQVRELLREIKVTRAGTVVTAEVELDVSLAAWLEALFPQLLR